MGVPKFFRWAGERYPAIVSGVLTEKSPEQRAAELSHGTARGLSHLPTTLPPIDNLYLDMNGIIHNQSHSNNQVINADVSAEEVIVRMTEFIDYLVTQIVVPQRLLFMAIDGVAPRAKLNQQRARRFRAAKNLEIQQNLVKEQTGESVENAFDSNCITPGTEFMARISQGMQAFIQQKLQQAPAGSVWAGLTVIFSGSEVPGEGEHKIMSYIRSEKAAQRMPPNTRHCIYGADADMLMLSLATHEPYVVIIREILEFKNEPKQAPFHGSVAVLPHTNPAADKEEEDAKKKEAKEERKKMQYVRIHILREYLYREFCEDSLDEVDWDDVADLTGGSPSRNTHKGDHNNKRKARKNKDKKPSVWDIERIIDDFVFLTFLIGNDFLPHLPGLDIGDAAFDIIFDAYKNTMDESSPRYLVAEGELDDLDRLQTIFSIIGTAEAVVFTEKETMASIRAQKKQKRAQEAAQAQAEGAPHHASSPQRKEKKEHAPHHKNEDKKDKKDHHESHRDARHTAKKDSDDDKEEESSPLSEEDLRRAYYAKKLRLLVDDAAVKFLKPEDVDKPRVALSDLVHEYLLGLAWNLAYYTKGCVSWGWYYPFHYGPFLQDMVNIVQYVSASHKYLHNKETKLEGSESEKSIARSGEVVLALDWEQGQPLTPFEQLLACLPPKSAKLLPAAYDFLMNDPTSPIVEYYPKNFKTDLNGKKQDYEAVVLLPFIDDERLKAAEAEFAPPSSLSAESLQRNTSVGVSHIYQRHVESGVDNAVLHKEYHTSIEHAEPFKPVLIPGTQPVLPFFEHLSDLLAVAQNINNRDYFGKTVYVTGGRGGGGRGGGRGNGRGGGRGGRGGDDRHDNDHYKKNGGFPMPGKASPPRPPHH